MSDAERLQKEIDYLSVLIKRHKEGNLPSRGNRRNNSSKHFWSNQQRGNSSYETTVSTSQVVSNPMQRGKRHLPQHHSWPANKFIRHYEPPRTTVQEMKKTGVMFNSKFKWMKNSSSSQEAVTTKVQSLPRAAPSAIAHPSSTAEIIPSTSSHSVMTYQSTMENNKYKYRKTTTSDLGSTTVKPRISSHFHTPRARHAAKRTTARRSSPRWTIRSPASNPYKLNRLSKVANAKRTPAKSGSFIVRKNTKVRQGNDKRQSSGTSSTHITLSKVALEGLLQKHSVTLKQVLAKKAIAKSHETTRIKMHDKKKQYCLYYGRFGKCMRGDSCKFIHDPSRVAVCTRFLRGTCRDEQCSFSHKVSLEKVPVCLFFLRGKCSVPKCPYLHVYLGKDAPICQRFAFSGYCPNADQCKMQHLKCCPDYYETGKCSKGKKCVLPHFWISKFRVKKEASTDEKDDSEKKKNLAGSDIK